MPMLLCKSKEKSLAGLVEASARLGCPCLFLSKEAAKDLTGLGISAAFCLARHSFESKSNISGKLANEALLYLSRETNFSSAVRRMGAKSPDEFVLACEKEIAPLAAKRALGLSHARVMNAPSTGKRKGHYAVAELAIEEMALSRVKN